MPMNLVVIPLEGMSQTLFWQYRNAMPILWQMSERAIMFRRFYSASTSAFQSFCDFMHGDSAELDHHVRFPTKRGCLLGRARNLFAILSEQGYATMGIQHAGAEAPYLKDNCLGAWPDSCGEFRRHGEYDAFFAESLGFIEQAAAVKKPFALYLSDRASAVIDNCAEKRDAKLFHQRFEKGYELLDQSVDKVMVKLESLGLLDNTVICVFGPYGMDPWKHGVYAGRTNAMDPYADVCWTPMFLYNNSRDAKNVDSLASSIDLKDTLLELLFGDSNLGGARGNFSGVSLLSMSRDVAFTQNMFALERENAGPARGLAKSYAATDGDQRLIVSSDGGIAGNGGGMELYYDPRDSTGMRNLLDFFTMDKEGTLASFGRNDATHPHFLFAFRPDKPEWLIRSVVNSYNTMRDILKKLVKLKEGEALKHCVDAGEAQTLNDTLFTFKRERM